MSEKTNQRKLEKEKENGLSCDVTTYHSRTLSESNLIKKKKKKKIVMLLFNMTWVTFFFFGKKEKTKKRCKKCKIALFLYMLLFILDSVHS